VDDRGAPLVDASVFVYLPDFSGGTTTVRRSGEGWTKTTSYPAPSAHSSSSKAGRFRLEHVPSGGGRVVVLASGYKDLERPLGADETALGDLVLVAEATRTLTGQVSSGRQPVAKAKVQVALAHQTLEATTDDAGRFSLEDVPARPLVLTVEKAGSKPASVELAADQTELAVELGGER
jgi:hypothetical protein